MFKIVEFFSNFNMCPPKLLVYTRQSYIFGSLPSVFPSDTTMKSIPLIEAVIYDDLQSLKILKVSPDISEGEIEKHVTSFMDDTSRNIFILTANMQDVTAEMINYLRIVIEQQEYRSSNHKKLIVIVLHFPQAQFFKRCYPALFLTGWDHYYLDSLTTDIKVGGHLAHKNVVDIKQFFHIALHMEKKAASVSIDLEPLLEEAIPVISSRVTVGSSGKQYNTIMSISARQNQLRKLLFNDAGGCTLIGKAFCLLFQNYWDDTTVTNFLKDAAYFTFSHQSSLSITNYIQTRIKALFFEFVLIVLWKINENCNLDVVFQNNTKIQEIFAIVIKSLFPKQLPRLHELSKYRSLPSPENKGYQFPFFDIVYHYMEELLDGCQEIMNQRNTKTSGRSSSNQSSHATKDTLKEDMMEEMQKKIRELSEVSIYYSFCYEH